LHSEFKLVAASIAFNKLAIDIVVFSKFSAIFVRNGSG
jgi:hypothetical protein